jgi:hypothetical protein
VEHKVGGAVLVKPPTPIVLVLGQDDSGT